MIQLGIGTSIVLIAAGAILRWGIHWSSSTVSVATIGLVLFIVGLVGLVISLAVFGPWGYRTRSRRRVTDSTGRVYLDEEQRVDQGAPF